MFELIRVEAHLNQTHHRWWAVILNTPIAHFQ